MSRPAADEGPRHTREKISGTQSRQGRLLTQTGPPSNRNEMIDRLPENLCNIFRFYDNHFLVFENINIGDCYYNYKILYLELQNIKDSYYNILNSIATEIQTIFYNFS